MKKLSCFLLAAWLVFGLSVPTAALGPEEEIQAEAAVLIDADTGQVLYDKNMNARKYPASTTKIMTGLLTVENCAPDEIVTVSEQAVENLYGTSHIALTDGEQLPVDSAMYALMLPSANDAANALAEHVAGSQQSFAASMTQRAKEIGALNTRFTNPSGLPDPNHYTTAYDLAIITAEAVRNPDFLRYFGTDRHIIPATNMQDEERPFTNQQYMLLSDMWVYNPDVIGGKVGYTEEARHTMSTVARKNGRTLVAVVLGCGIDQKFYDTQSLLDFGFDSFQKVTVPLPVPEQATAAVLHQGEPVGEAAFRLPQTEAELLLPKGVTSSDIDFRFDIPEQVEQEQIAETALVLSMNQSPGVGVPVQLLRIPLEPEIRYNEGVEPALRVFSLSESSGAEEKDSSGRSWWGLLPAAVVAGLLALFLMRRRRFRIIAEKRRRRLQTMLRMQRDEGAA